MDPSTKNFRELETIQLSDTIVTMSASEECLAVGCLDDSLRVWKHTQDQLEKNMLFSWMGAATGIIDVKLNPTSTYLAGSFMDSKIRQWEIQSQKMTMIDCPVMSAWKIELINNHIVSCGDLGRINFYNQSTGEHARKLEAGDIHLTSVCKTLDDGYLAVGSNNGSSYIVNLQKKDKIASLKPHYKLIRSMSFTQDSSKLLTGSDDTTIKIIDIASEKIVSSLEGHKQSVSSIHCHPNDSRIAYSCSFDKSVRGWDLRMKSAIGNVSTGSGLWSCEVVGKKLFAGGENGVLFVYSIE